MHKYQKYLYKKLPSTFEVTHSAQHGAENQNQLLREAVLLWEQTV